MNIADLLHEVKQPPSALLLFFAELANSVIALDERGISFDMGWDIATMDCDQVEVQLAALKMVEGLSQIVSVIEPRTPLLRSERFERRREMLQVDSNSRQGRLRNAHPKRAESPGSRSRPDIKRPVLPAPSSGSGP